MKIGEKKTGNAKIRTNHINDNAHNEAANLPLTINNEAIPDPDVAFLAGAAPATTAVAGAALGGGGSLLQSDDDYEDFEEDDDNNNDNEEDEDKEEDWYEISYKKFSPDPVLTLDIPHLI